MACAGGESAARGPLLRVDALRVQFDRQGPPARAVDGVTFDVCERETVALVGESGCGKSVTALALARLLPVPPARYAGGTISFDGEDVLAMDRKPLRRLRGGRIAYVFQEPSVALNPVMRVGRQILEALRLHRPDAATPAEVACALAAVGLGDARRTAAMYPHELSGGMKQRVMVAMALSCRPRLLVADEPTTALDVTIQAQILDLLRDLQGRQDMAILFITHNLGLVAGLADRVLVMYAGRIVESGPVAAVLRRPAHPYTAALLNAVPRMARGEGSEPVRVAGIPGSVPDPAAWPAGCTFAPRCDHCAEKCRAEEPPALCTGAGREARCWFPLVRAEGGGHGRTV